MLSLLSTQHSALSTSWKEAASLEKLGVQECGARCAADGVVHQGDHSQIHHRAGTHPADRHAHSVFAVTVQTGLRSIRFFEKMKGLLRCRGQSQPLRLTAERPDAVL